MQKKNHISKKWSSDGKVLQITKNVSDLFFTTRTNVSWVKASSISETSEWSWVSERCLRPSNTKRLYNKEKTELGETEEDDGKNGKVKRKNKETVLLLCLTSTLQPVWLERPYQKYKPSSRSLY